MQFSSHQSSSEVNLNQRFRAMKVGTLAATFALPHDVQRDAAMPLSQVMKQGRAFFPIHQALMGFRQSQSSVRAKLPMRHEKPSRRFEIAAAAQFNPMPHERTCTVVVITSVTPWFNPLGPLCRDDWGANLSHSMSAQQQPEVVWWTCERLPQGRSLVVVRCRFDSCWLI